MCGTLAKMRAKKSHLTPAQVFGHRLRETRERRGWKQGEFADQLGIDRTTLNKIENGTRGDVKISQLFEFAKALDIAPIYLLTPRLDDVGVVVTPGSKPMRPRDARRWIRGEVMRRGVDPVEWLLDLPRDEQQIVLEELGYRQAGADTELLRGLKKEEIAEWAAALLEALERKDKENDA
jgi:transcriptional regulator with XRE-family HTH domain